VRAPSFSRVFRQLAGRVRRRRALRSALSGATFGALGAALGAFALLELGLAEWRPFAGGAVAIGLLLGVLQGRRRRWSDTEVALFLDARLRADESFTTGVVSSGADPAAVEVAQERAIEHLARAEIPALGPRVWLRRHALLPVLALAFAGVVRLPPPKAPPGEPAAPGAEVVQKADVPGLDRIEALSSAQALSAADAERLAALAREARKLSEDLKRGIEQREAQARIGRLRDEIAGERRRLTSAAERPGLEAALRALEADKSTFGAGKALAEGDITGFDDELRKLANAAETESRKAARDALEQAVRAARERGSKQLEELLERQKQSFAERQALGRMLRELSEQLGKQLDDSARRELDSYLDDGNPESAERLSEAYARALAGLSEAERQRLAEALKRELGKDPLLGEADPKRVEELLDSLKTEQGQRALSEALRELSRGGRDAHRDRALEDAERGGAEAERSLGGLPVPLPGNAATPGGRAPGAAPGQGQPGAGPGSGPGAGHGGRSTAPVDAPELRAKAQARVLPGVPLAAKGFGRAPAASGERASEPRSGELGAARAEAIGAIEGSDVPEDYREQVGRYFEP
jgi:hypothetical protein